MFHLRPMFYSSARFYSSIVFQSIVRLLVPFVCLCCLGCGGDDTPPPPSDPAANNPANPAPQPDGKLPPLRVVAEDQLPATNENPGLDGLPPSPPSGACSPLPRSTCSAAAGGKRPITR